MTIMKAAIYARVSTKDKGQDVENQLVQLRRYADSQGWEAVEYVDHETGKHSDRDGFQRLFEGASRREFGVVVVWALDRFTREGVGKTFGHIDRLAAYGVKFESFTEAHFRTTGPAGELMIAVAAWIAKQERIRISERTKAGLATARNKGKTLGRPRRIFRRDYACALREGGMSVRAIAERLDVPKSTVMRLLAAEKARVLASKKVSQKPHPKRVCK
jgi:DNA invertase Pin-like site-specific DNA recombinase